MEQEIRQLHTKAERQAAGVLFAGWEETMIWSCLQNVMGQLFMVGEGSAMAALGDFIFLAGVPDEGLAAYWPQVRSHDQSGEAFRILVPQHAGWNSVIASVYGERAKQVQRYGTKKEPAAFTASQRAALEKMAADIPAGFVLRCMDETLYHACMEQDWSKDLVAQYEDYGVYHKLGLGVCALQDGKLVAGASSYSSYEGGIEVEIDTKKGYRRRGLAKACGARLRLECLKRGLYASWDAQNLASLALAQKLGYTPAGPYIAYEVSKKDAPSGSERDGKDGTEAAAW